MGFVKKVHCTLLADGLKSPLELIENFTLIDLSAVR